MPLFHLLGTSCSGTTTRTTSQHPISPGPRQVQPRPHLSFFAPAPSTLTLTLVVTLTRMAGCVWSTFPGHASTKYTATMQIKSSDKVFLRAVEMPPGGVAAPSTCPPARAAETTTCPVQRPVRVRPIPGKVHASSVLLPSS
jgi:hypothetical protein